MNSAEGRAIRLAERIKQIVAETLDRFQIVGKKDRRGNKVRRGVRLRAADPLLRNDDGGSADRPSQTSPEATDAFSAGQQGVWDGHDPLGDDA